MIRGYIPNYLDDELTLKSAERRVTKTFLIMEALAKAGYRVEEHPLRRVGYIPRTSRGRKLLVRL